MKVGIISPYPAMRAALIAFFLQAGSVSVEVDVDSVGQLRRGLQACPNIWVIHVPHAGELSQAVRCLHMSWPDTPILALMDETQKEFEIEAIKAGARGLVSWDSTPVIFLKALRAVAHGEVWLSDRAAKAYIAYHLIPLPPKQQSSAKITAREGEVLAIAASGRRSAEIASQLHISLTTVRTHLGTIYRKLGVGNRTSAALAYLHDLQGRTQGQRNASWAGLDGTEDKAKPAGREMTPKNSNAKNDA
jgi:DNA-binding NarL/FixJ family response regulator